MNIHELYSRLRGPFLSHVGVGRDDPRLASESQIGSGRYHKGTGEHPNQREIIAPWSREGFDELRAKGLTPKEIAAYYHISQNTQRRLITEGNTERVAKERDLCLDLAKKGYGVRAISRQTGLSPQTVSKRISSYTETKLKKEEFYKEFIRDEVEKKGHIDVGSGNEYHLGVSKTKLDQIVKSLVEQEGYVYSRPMVPQAGTTHDTQQVVLSKPGTPKNYVYNHIEEIQPMGDLKALDLGDKIERWKPHAPVSVDSKRLQVVFNEEGGLAKDGVIELRRTSQDLNLNNHNYAQVRIIVDGTHYLKGMAVYSDNLPPGVDIRFNTNKHQGTPIMGDDPDNTVLKPTKGQGLNAFKAVVRQQNDWVDADGVKHEGPINIVKEQGLWHEQQKTLASQFLGKQSPDLAKKQLTIDYEDRENEFNEIMALTNPVVKQKMLKSFADDCDAAAVHLKAAALPRQSWNVILPVNSLKDDEIYAPGYKNGEEVVCIRYPHAGRFELRQLKVNNNNEEGRKILGPDAFDAVGITKKSADILSGADFDGDTVIVLPNPKKPTANGKFRYDIQVDSPLEELKDFDPKEAYPGYAGMKRMTKRQHGIEMGIVSNLITDMTIAGASEDELAKAAKHSMVVVDAEKHGLDFRKSYRDNDIKALKIKYQGGGGVATLLSRAKSPRKVYPKMRNNPYDIDPETGAKIWNYEKPKKYTDKDGVEHIIPPRKVDDYWMATVEDANELLSSPTRPYKIEQVYAEYANNCKALANKARKAYLISTKNDHIEFNKEAAQEYAAEVKELNRKLTQAQINAPKERAAQRLAYRDVKAKADAAKLAGNELSEGEKRKLLAKQIESARREVGAKKDRVTFTDREWEAVQKGAIRITTLRTLLANADEANYKEKATPRDKRGLSSYKVHRIEQMLASLSGDSKTDKRNMQDIAEYFGVSVSTIAAIKAGKY